MSTLEVSNLNDRTTTVATTNLTNGSAKVWVNYYQNNNTVDDSFNVSSVSDDATGLFTVNFTTSFSNANYAPVGMTRGYHIIQSTSGALSDSKTTSLLKLQQFYVSSTGGNRTDIDLIAYLGMWGDQA